MKNKRLISVLAIALTLLVTAGTAQAIQIFTDAIRVPSLQVGKQGAGGVTYFNGTMLNNTTDTNGTGMPLTVGDDLRVDGNLFRTEIGGSNPLKLADSLKPVTDATYSLGTADYQFKDGYFSGALTASTLTVSTLALTSLSGTGVITADNLATDAVTSAKIADGTIATSDLTDSAITSAKIVDGTITSNDLTVDFISSAQIVDGTITTGDLSDSAITTAKITDGTIATADLADDAVTSNKITAGTIATSDIADEAVTQGVESSLATVANIANGEHFNTLQAINITTGDNSALCLWSGYGDVLNDNEFIWIQMLLDGTLLNRTIRIQRAPSGMTHMTLGTNAIIPMSAGAHTVSIQWDTTTSANMYQATLDCIELKK